MNLLNTLMRIQTHTQIHTHSTLPHAPYLIRNTRASIHLKTSCQKIFGKTVYRYILKKNSFTLVFPSSLMHIFI